MSDERLRQALEKLALAEGGLALADWQDHPAAVGDAVEALSDFFMHVDVLTGEYDPAPIYLDTSRVVFGLIPAAVEPLVRLLQQQTAELDLALEDDLRLSEHDEPRWRRWHDRLTRYVVRLEAELAHPLQPSERLWREVTAPLLQGIYPADFDQLGIINPTRRSKPDVTTVMTTAWLAAMHTQQVSRFQAWLLRWHDAITTWTYETKLALRAVIEALREGVREGVRSGAKRAARPLMWGLVAGGITWAVWWTSSRGRRTT
jgi:hypothetical protein